MFSYAIFFNPSQLITLSLNIFRKTITTSLTGTIYGDSIGGSNFFIGFTSFMTYNRIQYQAQTNLNTINLVSAYFNSSTEYSFTVIRFFADYCPNMNHPYLHTDDLCYDVCLAGLFGSNSTWICEECDTSCNTC
jgi:hypothetical protein